jgi:hypothetical protein
VAIAAFGYWRKIRLEEKNLDVGFGAEHEADRREAWALVPGVFEPAEPWIILDRVTSFALPGLAQIAAARPLLASLRQAQGRLWAAFFRRFAAERGARLPLLRRD